MDEVKYEPPSLARDPEGDEDIYSRYVLGFPAVVMEIMEYEYRPPEAELLRWCQGR